MREYAKKNKLTIAGEYVDEGISARKPYTARPELLRLLSDVEQGKIDTVLFTKLDRWFRDIAEYYKVEEILRKYHVTWQATQEDYETETANGRFKVNIMLSAAQDEADRAGERVKAAFDRKRQKGEQTGRLPKGYRYENKRAVIDEDGAKYVRKVYELRMSGASITEIVRAFPNSGLSYSSIISTLKNPAYTGRAYGFEYPQIVTQEEFDLVQRIGQRTRIQNRTGEQTEYLFLNLLYCPCCGKRLTGNTTIAKSGDIYHYYRCPNKRVYPPCTAKLIREDKIEGYLLDNIESKLQAEIIATTNREEAKSYADDRKRIQRKISRLNDLYINEDIDRQEYESRKAKLENELSAIPADKEEVSIRRTSERFFGDWKEVYGELSRQGKRLFWVQTINEIKLDENRNVIDFSFRA